MKSEIKISDIPQNNQHIPTDVPIQALLESLYFKSRPEEEKITFEEKRAEALAEWQRCVTSDRSEA